MYTKCLVEIIKITETLVLTYGKKNSIIGVAIPHPGPIRVDNV